ncbi:MAG: ANTAR domain-containing protein [Desulfarculus sp.]|nr:ANTAR domain-containing protein [Desulfarculus sp.]
MPSPIVVLIQKPDSPYRARLEAALNQEYGNQGWRCFEAIQQSLHPGTPLIVLWDLFGHLPVEVHALAGVLAQEGVGVVVACGQVDDLVRQALRATSALALVADPELPVEVAAALEVAGATHQRLLDLTTQRQELQREIQERHYIEKAKRVLMAAKGYSEAEAMRHLQKHSRNSNQKLVAVAQRVLAAYKVFNGESGEE